MIGDYSGHADRIKQIKEEYENTAKAKDNVQEVEVTSSSSKGYRAGDIWYNCVANEYFICNGRINGKANWVRFNGNYFGE